MAKGTPKKILPLLEGEIGEQRLIRFWSNVGMGPTDQCWEWKLSGDGHGYGRFKIASYIQVRASRVALVAHTMSEPEGMFALHHCDNRKCCNPAHLYWGTHQDNMDDMNQRGRHRTGDQSGANNGAAKITERQLETIVARLQAGWNNKQIAADLPVTHSMVSLIRLGKMWRKQTEALGYEPHKPHRRSA